MPFNIHISHMSPDNSSELVNSIEINNASYQFIGFFDLPGSYNIKINESIYAEIFEATIRVNDVNGIVTKILFLVK